jgi:FlaA1/EpsC-like NDP-sugar epimerase
VERLLRVSAARGLAPVPVDVIGLRPGEKLTEELTMQGAAVARSDDPDIWVAHEAAPPRAAVKAALRSLVRAVARGDSLKTVEALTAALPDFTPSAQAWACARAERFYLRRDRRRAAKIA